MFWPECLGNVNHSFNVSIFMIKFNFAECFTLVSEIDLFAWTFKGTDILESIVF